jgi:hypothetical protein
VAIKIFEFQTPCLGFKIENRRLASRQAATEILRDLVVGKADAYEGCRHLYSLWCANDAAPQELRHYFGWMESSLTVAPASEVGKENQ